MPKDIIGPDRDSLRAVAPEAVRVAVIVPTHRQPGLLAEALDTVLMQQADFDYAVVVVNDGCPYPETHRVSLEFSAANPGRVFYLHKRNGGLSAARNTGIEFALKAFPALEAVYFLDSDNRLGPHLLARLFDALRSAGPHIGWAYPDIDKIGLPEICDTSGPYSPLEHLFRNVSEAGSMASRRLLESGARFDTSLRQGCEDWEFWLQGLERGFLGIHVPMAGFGYRRRGESMLAEAERDLAPILAQIRALHPRLFSVPAVVEAEASFGRRYAVFLPDIGVVRCVTRVGGPDIDLSVEEFCRIALRALERPGYGICPGQVVVMASAAYQRLEKAGLLAALLWLMEAAVAQATAATAHVAPESGGPLSWSVRGQAHPPGTFSVPAAGADIAAVRTAQLLDAVRNRPGEPFALRRDRFVRFDEVRVDLTLPPGPEGGEPRGVEGLCDLYESLRGAWLADGASAWSSADLDRFRSQVPMPEDVYGSIHRLPSVFQVPRPAGDGRPQAALAVDPADGPEALATAVQLAAWLRGQGWGAHLVALGSGGAGLPAGSLSAFDSVVPFPFAPRPSLQSDAYLGTPIPRFDGLDRDFAVGTLSGFALVVTVQHALAHTLTGELKRRGIPSLAILGLGPPERQLDAVTACAAFEHAYQAIALADAEALRLCRALGFPPEKLFRFGGEASDPDWDACPPLPLLPISSLPAGQSVQRQERP